MMALLTREAAAGAFNTSERRWGGYLQTVLGEPSHLDADMKWTSVKQLRKRSWPQPHLQGYF